MDRTMLKHSIKKLAKSKNSANFYFSFDENYYNLIPLKTSNKLVLAAHDADFFIDGCIIAPYKFIIGIYGKGDKYNDILKAERVTEDINIPEINIKNIQSACKYFFEKSSFVSVEYKSKKHSRNFAVGKIADISKKHFLFSHFDAEGVWEKKPRKIKYSDIFIIHFLDRYTETFSRYVGIPEPAGVVTVQ